MRCLPVVTPWKKPEGIPELAYIAAHCNVVGPDRPLAPHELSLNELPMLAAAVVLPRKRMTARPSVSMLPPSVHPQTPVYPAHVAATTAATAVRVSTTTTAAVTAATTTLVVCTGASTETT